MKRDLQLLRTGGHSFKSFPSIHLGLSHILRSQANASLSSLVSCVEPTEHCDYKWLFFSSQHTGCQVFWPSLNSVQHKEAMVTGVELIWPLPC